MERKRADLHKSVHNHPLEKKIKKQLKNTPVDELTDKLGLTGSTTKNTRTETKDGLEHEYLGEQSIQSREQAIKFFKVDTSLYEVDKFVANAWDVTMKIKKDSGETDKNNQPIMVDVSEKRTNYAVKLSLKKIQKLVISKPLIKPFKFNKKGKAEMWLIPGCIHRPFHNKVVWNKIMNLIHDYKKEITGIIINGDYLDLRSLSSHDSHIPSGIDLGFEYSDGLQGLTEIKQAFGKEFKRIEKVYHYGNHEDRFNRGEGDKRKYGSGLITPIEALRLNEFGYKIQDNWKDGYTTLGNDLEVLHGVYFGKTAAKSHLDIMPDRSVIFNHTHRFSTYDNGRHVAYNCGWLGDKDSPGFAYAPRTTKSVWRNGFSVAYVDKDGNSSVDAIRCTNNTFFFGGKIY